MFKVIYYLKLNGAAPVRSFLEELCSSYSKNSQIQYRQIMHHIKILETKGTRIGEPYTKHLENGV